MMPAPGPQDMAALAMLDAVMTCNTPAMQAHRQRLQRNPPSREQQELLDLCYAAGSGVTDDPDVLRRTEALLKAAADAGKPLDLDFREFTGQSPLHLAIVAGCVKQAEILIRYGERSSISASTSAVLSLPALP